MVFNPGVSTQTVTLTTLSDAQTEGDEDLTVTITVAADSGISVFAPEASVTITESSTFPCVCIYVHQYIISNVFQHTIDRKTDSLLKLTASYLFFLYSCY